MCLGGRATIDWVWFWIVSSRTMAIALWRKEIATRCYRETLARFLCARNALMRRFENWSKKRNCVHIECKVQRRKCKPVAPRKYYGRARARLFTDLSASYLYHTDTWCRYVRSFVHFFCCSHLDCLNRFRGAIRFRLIISLSISFFPPAPATRFPSAILFFGHLLRLFCCIRVRSWAADWEGREQDYDARYETKTDLLLCVFVSTTYNNHRAYAPT